MATKHGKSGARRAPAEGSFARLWARLLRDPGGGLDSKGGPGQMGVELAVAAIFTLFGCVVMADSVRVGIGWSSDGPRAGYFPFYVGLLVTANSLAVFVLTLLRRESARRQVFSNWDQLRRVAEVLVPSVLYVAAIPFLGMYVPTALYIVWFMRRIGRYRARKILPVALGVTFGAFVMFEIWFKVPLPKGPLESLLGL
jgi:hypothetical protein